MSTNVEGFLWDDGRTDKKKKIKVRHYRTPLCSFGSGDSFSSGGGERKKVRYVECQMF
jgi:hypothetical protein